MTSDPDIPEHDECPYCSGRGPVREYEVYDLEGSFDSTAGRVCIEDNDETFGVYVHVLNEAKKQVYRRYLRGEASEDDVREVFGEDFEEFEDRREFIAVVEETPTNEPSDDLIDQE